MSVIRPRRDPALSRAGFSLAELTVVLAVIGVLFSLSLPAFISYYQGAQVRAAAAEVRRKSTRLNSSHIQKSRMPSSA